MDRPALFELSPRRSSLKKNISLQAKLNQHLTSGYRSFAGSTNLADDPSTRDSHCDLNKNHNLSHLPKDFPLKQLVSGSPNPLDRSFSDRKDTDDDKFFSEDTLTPLVAVSIIFGAAVTVALFLHISLTEVCLKGVLVSDDERCSALGQRVLHDGGSSVDAAITAALCLGVVHPHVSGVGGGGVMLVHDINTNETRVIDFQGTAPKTLKEEMLQNVSGLKGGLQVGVPGMVRGLQCAHSLYGRLSWEDVVTPAADVAKEGFNVSFSLSEALSKIKGEKLSQRFRDLFFPQGHALRPGSFLKMCSLAEVLRTGVSHLYDGNFSQEIEDEVRANGGVLSRDDIRDYTVQVENPLEGRYNGFIIQVPPPPSAGATLISLLNLLEGFRLNAKPSTDNQTYHSVTEYLKTTLSMAGALGDPKYNSPVTELLSDMLSNLSGRVVVMGPDNLMVSVASTLGRPFGSRIITKSGVVLNSLVLDFSWPNKNRGQLSSQQINRVQPGKRPMSYLMPIIVVPAWQRCGIRMALSSTSGQRRLSAIAQVLISTLSSHKEKNESRLVDPEFTEEGLQYVNNGTHKVQRAMANSVVMGILRKSSDITAIPLPDSLL